MTVCRLVRRSTVEARNVFSMDVPPKRRVSIWLDSICAEEGPALASPATRQSRPAVRASAGIPPHRCSAFFWSSKNHGGVNQHRPLAATRRKAPCGGKRHYRQSPPEISIPIDPRYVQPTRYGTNASSPTDEFDLEMRTFILFLSEAAPADSGRRGPSVAALGRRLQSENPRKSALHNQNENFHSLFSVRIV